MTLFDDEGAAGFGVDRRKVLVAGGLMLGGALLPDVAFAALPAPAGNDATARFLELSHLLIPHRLDGEIGRRLALAMAKADPALPDQVDQLLAIAKAKQASIVEEFFPDIPAGPLKARALAIISAWYMGVIVDAPGAEVFAYELALMYQPTRDVMTIPSYAISKPNGWTSDAPPLGAMPVF